MRTLAAILRTKPVSVVTHIYILDKSRGGQEVEWEENGGRDRSSWANEGIGVGGTFSVPPPGNIVSPLITPFLEKILIP